jgi:hypothetical protein
MNKIFPAFLAVIILFIASCTKNSGQVAEIPSWFVAAKQNNNENLYGVAEGYTLEEATRYALADAAARLMVSISSNSNLIREENQSSVNEEMRQQVRQNVEKITFTGFQVTRSTQAGQRFFVEIQIARQPFINEQKQEISSLERQIQDLDKNSAAKNIIQRRNALVKIVGLGKELELKSRIIAGASENIDLEEKLKYIASFQNQLEKLSDNIEFYFEINSPKEITQIIRNNLNREKIKIALRRNNSNPNQIVIKVKTNSRSNKIYEAFMTKLEIDFESLAAEKVLASNSVEVSGSSSLGTKESYLAALKAFEEKINEAGILQIIGITN